VLNIENKRKSPEATENCRKQPKTANQKNKLLLLTRQSKLTLTITLILTDTVTLTSHTKLTLTVTLTLTDTGMLTSQTKLTKNTEKNRKQPKCFRLFSVFSNTVVYCASSGYQQNSEKQKHLNISTSLKACKLTTLHYTDR